MTPHIYWLLLVNMQMKNIKILKKIVKKNWINWEVKKAKDLGKKLFAVKIHSKYTYPD